MLAILSGTTVGSVVEAIRYRKQNKALKDSEAKQSTIETQRQEIELADLYKEKMLEMMELINVKQDKGNMNQDKMISMLGNLDTRVDNLEARVGNIEGCLDGRLKEYMETTAKTQKDEQNP